MSALRRLVTNETNPADSQGIAELLGAGKDSHGIRCALRYCHQ